MLFSTATLLSLFPPAARHNITIIYQNGTWPLDSAGPLLPRANYSEYYVKVTRLERLAAQQINRQPLACVRVV